MITITKEKIYRSTFSLKKTKSDSKLVNEINVKDIIFHMEEEVEFGEDVAFERIFDIIIFHKEFFNILFNSDLNNLKIDDFIDDYEKKNEAIDSFKEYILTVFWSGIVYESDEEVDYYDFSVLEAIGRLDTRVEEEEYPISIALTSLSEFRKKLITIDNFFEIQNEESYESELGAAFEADYRPLNLINIISAILREISQHGKPEDRELSKQEIERAGQEINKWIEDGSIGDKIVYLDSEEEIMGTIHEDYQEENTFWDVLYPNSSYKSKKISDSGIHASEDFLEAQLREAEEIEDYERAAEIKKEIDILKKKHKKQ